MDMNLVSGRVFSEVTDATKDKDGFWKIKVNITEKIIFTDGTEREESINSEAMDMDFGVAHQMALFSALTELQELVYAKEFDSLIEGRDYQRSLEADNVSDSKADTDTPTQ